MKSKYLAFLLFFVLSLGADQWSKHWARQTLRPSNSPTAAAVVKPNHPIKGYWEWRYSENPGAAFGLLRDQPGSRYFFFAIGVICVLVVGSWLYRMPSGAKWTGLKLGLLAGGAIGNMVDRALYSRVTDFVVWKITVAGRVFEWPTFNVADAALVVGVILILLDRPRDRMDEPVLDKPTAESPDVPKQTASETV